MIDISIQIGNQPVGTVSFALTLISSILGLAVGYIAFQGYQRNRSLPMLFVATGFLLAFWTPVLLLGSFIAMETFGQFASGMAGTVDVAFSLAGKVSRIIGLLCILYGLRMPLRR